MDQNKNRINDIIRSLSKEDREMLRYAHTYGTPAYVKLPHNRFIGVHCQGVRRLIITDNYNDWYIGALEQSNGQPHQEST
jgi:hypothetical protein